MHPNDYRKLLFLCDRHGIDCAINYDQFFKLKSFLYVDTPLEYEQEGQLSWQSKKTFVLQNSNLKQTKVYVNTLLKAVPKDRFVEDLDLFVILRKELNSVLKNRKQYLADEAKPILALMATWLKPIIHKATRIRANKFSNFNVVCKDIELTHYEAIAGLIFQPDNLIAFVNKLSSYPSKEEIFYQILNEIKDLYYKNSKKDTLNDLRTQYGFKPVITKYGQGKFSSIYLAFCSRSISNTMMKSILINLLGCQKKERLNLYLTVRRAVEKYLKKVGRWSKLTKSEQRQIAISLNMPLTQFNQIYQDLLKAVRNPQVISFNLPVDHEGKSSEMSTFVADEKVLSPLQECEIKEAEHLKNLINTGFAQGETKALENGAPFVVSPLILEKFLLLYYGANQPINEIIKQLNLSIYVDISPNTLTNTNLRNFEQRIVKNTLDYLIKNNPGLVKTIDDIEKIKNLIKEENIGSDYLRSKYQMLLCKIIKVIAVENNLKHNEITLKNLMAKGMSAALFYIPRTTNQENRIKPIINRAKEELNQI